MSRIEELVVRNASWIRDKARNYYRNREDADDLASETIFKCLSQGRKFDSSRSFKPWAQTIMANTYITQYNRRRCVLFTSLMDEDTTVGGIYADQRAAVNMINSVVAKCGRESCCIECVMLYADGYSHAEIAEMKGIPTGTVKSRISAGRKMLREALSD